MKKKILAGLLCCLLAVSTLAGCGGQQDAGSADVTESSQSTESTESAESSESAESTEDTESAASEEAAVTEEVAITMNDVSPMDLVKDMKIGWNLGNTLDSTSSKIGVNVEMAWGNPKTTQEMIDAVIDQGFNVIRIPVSWGGQMGAAPAYNVLPAWMDRVQEVVDYAYNRGVYVIVNIHHEDWHFPSEENKDAAAEQLTALWTAIATRFRDYDEHLIFEGMNEPRKIGTAVEWNGGDQEGRDVVNYLDQVFVDAVRATGGNNTIRNLMVPGYAASSSDEALEGIVLPDDDHLIVSVHAYTPYDFALNTAGRSTWDNDTRDIDHLMEKLDELFLSKGVPVIIGEFGAMNKDNEAERVEWAKYYVSKAREYGVPCVWWDNNSFDGDGENFGLFNRRELTFPYPDLLKALIDSAYAEE
ncbi:MAG: glycoside hydrolase family 5 protein [Lachnospiraceae bacterium]|nr:glycoside hydrolase family 5 protein [Lachnospiraceae bacterium]